MSRRLLILAPSPDEPRFAEVARWGRFGRVGKLGAGVTTEAPIIP